MFEGSLHVVTGPATPHITRINIGIKFLPSNSSEGRCVFLFAKTCVSAKVVFLVSIKIKIWKFVPLY